MNHLETKLGTYLSCICKNFFSFDLRFVWYLPSLCRNNDCCVYPWNQTDDPSQDEKLKSFCFVFALSRLASNLFICVCVCVLIRTASIITTQFLAVLLPFNNKGETIQVATVYQLRKTEENRFRLLCSETNQKAQF